MFKENGTIEFRLLESTFSFPNILYWTLLNTAIVLYALKEKAKIFERKEKITLEDCVYSIYDERVSQKLLLWIQSRRQKYENYLTTMTDFSEDRHFANDISKVDW